MSGRMSLVHSLALGAWFVLLWVALWADLSVANLLSGAAVALVVVLLDSRVSGPPRANRARVSPIGVVVFVVYVLWSLVKSNLSLAWEIVTLNDEIPTDTVEVPLRSTSPAVAMAVSNAVTLTPGTVTLGVADDSSSLTIGILRLREPDEIRRDVQHTERLAIRAFGSHDARLALQAERS